MTRRRFHLNIFAVVVVAAALLHCAGARRTFVVGGSVGWALPPKPNTYAIWASNHSFAVDDILLFKFKSGNNTVAKVSKEAYEACNTTASPIFIRRKSPAFISLSTTGVKFFLDTVGDHCLKGQKVAVNVTPLAPAPSQQPPPPTNNPPSPPTSPPPSPPGNSPTGSPVAPSPPPVPSTAPPPTTTAPTSPPTTTPSPAPPPKAGASPPLSSSGPPPSTAPPLASTSPPPPPPPPNGSAAAATGASFCAVFMSIALGCLVWN